MMSIYDKISMVIRSELLGLVLPDKLPELIRLSFIYEESVVSLSIESDVIGKILSSVDGSEVHYDSSGS